MMKKENLKKEKNKVVVIATLIVILLLIGIISYLLLRKSDDTLSIEMVSDKVEYTYGPGGYTESKVKVGDTLKIKILSDKELGVKCYSSNENILKFKDKTSVEVLSKGNASIYCEKGDLTSNRILVEVGE